MYYSQITLEDWQYRYLLNESERRDVSISEIISTWIMEKIAMLQARK